MTDKMKLIRDLCLWDCNEVKIFIDGVYKDVNVDSRALGIGIILKIN